MDFTFDATGNVSNQRSATSETYAPRSASCATLLRCATRVGECATLSASHPPALKSRHDREVVSHITIIPILNDADSSS
jgi:hypothetical protein